MECGQGGYPTGEVFMDKVSVYGKCLGLSVPDPLLSLRLNDRFSTMSLSEFLYTTGIKTDDTQDFTPKKV
jgi:hypothetical protein